MTRKEVIKILFLGWNTETIKNYLERPDVNKVVVFDSGDEDEHRTKYETLYSIYKDRVTFYEGNIVTNINSYLKLHAIENEKTHHFLAGELALIYSQE